LGVHFSVKIQFEGVFALFVSPRLRPKSNHDSKAILDPQMHSFALTFKEMVVSVTVYFKVEWIIPGRSTVK